MPSNIHSTPLQQHGFAITDALSCVTLAPTWPKGYYRLGTALAAVKKYGEAADSLRSLFLSVSVSVSVSPTPSLSLSLPLSFSVSLSVCLCISLSLLCLAR